MGVFPNTGIVLLSIFSPLLPTVIVYTNERIYSYISTAVYLLTYIYIYRGTYICMLVVFFLSELFLFLRALITICISLSRLTSLVSLSLSLSLSLSFSHSLYRSFCPCFSRRMNSLPCANSACIVPGVFLPPLPLYLLISLSLCALHRGTIYI